MKTKQWLILVFAYSFLLALSQVASNPVFEDDLDFGPDIFSDVDGRGEPGNDVLTLSSNSNHGLLPEKPTNLTITAVTESVIELSWNQKNHDALQGHNINYKTVKNGRPGTLHVQERLRGSGEVTTLPPWPTIPYGKQDGDSGITKLEYRLQDLEPATKYSITVSAFISRDKEVVSNEVVVLTGPPKSGVHRVSSPPIILNTYVECVGKGAADVIWNTPPEAHVTPSVEAFVNTFYSFQYRKIINGNRNHGTTDWNYTQIITNGRNSTRMNAPSTESSPTWYEVRIGAGFAFDNATQRLIGEGSCAPHYSEIETVQIDPECGDKGNVNDISSVFYPSSSTSGTSTTTVRSTSPNPKSDFGFKSNTMWTTTSSTTPTSFSTTIRFIPSSTSSSTPSTDATVSTSTSTEPNRLQTTTTQQVLQVFDGDQFLRNDGDLKTVNTGEGIVMKIAEPTTIPSDGHNDTSDSTFGSSNPTLIIVSVSISTFLLIVLLVLLVWRNSKQCRSICVYGGNYYVDDPPRLPLLGSHNNGNIGWDGDGLGLGLGNNTQITCTAPAGGTATVGGGNNTGAKSSSQTNITMTSNDDSQAQAQQQQLSKESIPIHLFPKHVTELHTDGDIGFSKEYEVIQNASLQNDQFTSEYSHHPENKLKNRYLNIVAYDHTLVRVPSSSSSSSNSGCGLGSMGNGLTSGGSNKKWTQGYINGNYIDGFQKPYAYIGTQGPLPSTFETYWNVIWEHNVTTIVMITNLIERGRKKCDMYWPREIGATETYGLVQVRLKQEQVMATYTLRTFVVHHLKVKKKNMKKFMGKFGSNYQNAILSGAATVSAERMVYHYHYTNWPDHGTPSHTLPVLSFVKKSSHCNDVTKGGPIIVHCSAGVGRTGTYIVLDAMLKQIDVRQDVNVFGFLRHIRSQRNFLVQTEEQYIFIHDALLEAIQSGDTNVQQDAIAAYMTTLLTSTCEDETGVTTLLDYHFKLVTEFQPKDFQNTASLKPCNVSKIRSLDYICTDAYRVLLTPKAGIEGSDYINASFLPGYDKLHEFILTQHPMESTITSFWQMLSDHNVQTVVVLSAVDDNEFPVFWPTAESEDLELDTFRVKLLEESDRVGYVLRDLSIQSLADDDELNIKMIQSSHWPYHCVSIEQSMFQLIDVVMESVRETASTTTSPQGHGPVVIVDRFGGREGATFCALTTVVKQMEFESTVDVYMYAKLYNEQRPGVWRNPEDYLYMYRSLAELTSGECCIKDDGDEVEEASVSVPSSSPSTASNAGSAASGPPSPATRAAVSLKNTPCQALGIEFGPKKETTRDEVVVVVQIDQKVPESDQHQLALPTAVPTKPASPAISTNSSVAICLSQSSPVAERSTHTTVVPSGVPLMQTRGTNTGITPSPPPLIQQQSEPVNRILDLDFMPTLSAARTPSPKEPAARSHSSPSASVSLGLGQTGKINSIVRTTPSPVALKTPSPTKIEPLQITSPTALKTQIPVAQLVPSLQSPPALANGNGKGNVSPRPNSAPVLKSPSPVNVKTPSPKQGLSPVPPKTTPAPTPSPTRSENDSSLMPPIVQTPSPLKYDKEPSLSSIPTPSPPPPPLPSSPPPPGSMDGQNWDTVVPDAGMPTITPPPPPPQSLLESPIRPARGNGKGVSPTKSPGAMKQDNDSMADDAANLPPPPTLTEADGPGEKNGLSEQHEMTKLVQNGKHEERNAGPLSAATDVTNGNGNGNGMRCLLLEEIKEEDECSSEERVTTMLPVNKVTTKVCETEIGNGHAKNSAA